MKYNSLSLANGFFFNGFFLPYLFFLSPEPILFYGFLGLLASLRPYHTPHSMYMCTHTYGHFGPYYQICAPNTETKPTNVEHFFLIQKSFDVYDFTVTGLSS